MIFFGKAARLVGFTGMEASVTDGDEDQAAAQDGQTSDNDSEEASGNTIKVTHDTPLGSKGDGADQLIKTFGIFRGAGGIDGCFTVRCCTRPMRPVPAGAEWIYPTEAI